MGWRYTCAVSGCRVVTVDIYAHLHLRAGAPINRSKRSQTNSLMGERHPNMEALYIKTNRLIITQVNEGMRDYQGQFRNVCRYSYQA